jgi:glyoxylase-like metal-dependent hydrolase (beta-lactamase superfamily II)
MHHGSMNICTAYTRLVFFLMVTWMISCSPPAAEQGAQLADGRIRTVVFEPAGSTAYLVQLTGGGAIWIDVGIESDGVLLREAMSEAGVEADGLLGIFLTHGHGDHITGALAFPDVPVYAMAAEAPLVAGEVAPERPFPSGSPEPTGVSVGEPLDDETLMELSGTTIEAYAIPGHTDGSAAYVVHGVLFLGDAASRTNDGEVQGATWLFSKDTNASEASLRALGEKLADREDIHTLAFGHSAALEDGLPVFLEWLGVDN